MDLLSSVLSAMKLSGGVFLEAEFTAPWCVTSKIHPEECAPYFPQPEHVIGYHYVTSGTLLCAVGGEAPMEVRSGEILLLPHNQMHILGSCLDIEPTDSASLVEFSEDGLGRIVWGGGGQRTTICCGFLGTLTPMNAFLLSLPSALVVDTSRGASGEWMASSIRYASSEGAGTSPELLGKLAELLFAEAVKQYMQTLPEDRGGWLAGLRDHHVSRALGLLHSRCADAWTTDDLAREVGLSRSALADRFTRLLGEPPMRYLAKHRMNVAANLLQEGQQNSANVAYAVGFNSEAAFGRAFKKEFGMPPGAWKRRGQEPVHAIG